MKLDNAGLKKSRIKSIPKSSCVDIRISEMSYTVIHFIALSMKE